MKKVYAESTNIISPLGNSTIENFDNISKGNSGIKQHQILSIHEELFWASIFSKEQVELLSNEIHNNEKYTRFEKLIIASVQKTKDLTNINLASEDTIFILSTTKGNIELLEENKSLSEISNRISLNHSAKIICEYFNNKNTPIVISNACISGVVAILYARRLLESGKFKNAIIIGADTITKFIYSGFNSFMALSKEKCKPYSKERDGINLGEAIGTLALTTNLEILPENPVCILQGAISNDANHISGPSRTGEELSSAINIALNLSSLKPSELDFISAHGTGTVFNDEMEAKAFHLSNLEKTSINSLKGYFGHTLGAAGVVESIISFQCLKAGVIIPTIGFSELGVSNYINICSTLIEKELNYCLKTASGFGGCNAALIYSFNIN